mgnify:CR=1 FL=1
MQFVDEVDIHIQSGHGGSGSLSFRREKFVPRGGPNGGDGGKDNSAYADADPGQAAGGPVDSFVCFAGDLKQFPADVSEAGGGESFIDALAERLQCLDGFFRVQCAVHAGFRCESGVRRCNGAVCRGFCLEEL